MVFNFVRPGVGSHRRCFALGSGRGPTRPAGRLLSVSDAVCRCGDVCVPCSIDKMVLWPLSS